MTEVYFHGSHARKAFVDRRGAVVDDLTGARDHASFASVLGKPN